MIREPAWRLFAAEYNETTCRIEGEGEKTPSYIVTPLGAKVNRLYVVGVLTNVEDLSNEGEMLRAHVSWCAKIRKTDAIVRLPDFFQQPWGDG